MRNYRFLTFFLIFLGILSFALFIKVTPTLSAVTPPDFPSCVNPQGTLTVTYDSGVHGIPGKTESYQGSDSVYSVSADTLTQCLCTENGDGIQTNWWKTSSLTSTEIETLKTQGWVFIPDGASWGLDPVAYMAKNSDYACRGLGMGGGVGEVLGLATTGNINTIYAFLGAGLLSLALGLLLKKRHSRAK